MSDPEGSDFPLRTTWYYVTHYWHWPVLVAVGLYAYRQFLPSIELAEPGRPAPALAARHFPGEVVPRTYPIDKQGRIRYKHSGVILKWALDDALEQLVQEPAPTGQAALPSTGSIPSVGRAGS